GTVAFEMAGQLEAAGAEVRLLAMLDSTAPVEAYVDVGEHELMFQLLRDLGGVFAIKQPLALERLQSLAPEALLDAAIAYVKEARLLLPATEERELKRHVSLYRTHMNAHLHHAPRAFGGPVLFVSPSQQANPFADAVIQRWRKLSTGRFEVMTIPGDHR